MKLKFIPLALLVSAAFLANHALATEVATNKAPTPTAKAVKPSAQNSTKVSKAKLVDINTASSAELQKLPNISEADAVKIISGRPYGSKTWLVSHKILAEERYPAISRLIIAKQPNKDAGKNAALYKKK